MAQELSKLNIFQLNTLEESLQEKVSNRLRNMKYDDELNLLFNELEEVIQERNRRGTKDNG